MKRQALIFLSIGLLMGASSLFAHHVDQTYDLSESTRLIGTVNGFEWGSPHSKIHFKVEDEQGNVKNWVGELPSSSALAERGWTENSIQAEDEVTLTGSPAEGDQAMIWITQTVVVKRNVIGSRRGYFLNLP